MCIMNKVIDYYQIYYNMKSQQKQRQRFNRTVTRLKSDEQQYTHQKHKSLGDYSYKTSKRASVNATSFNLYTKILDLKPYSIHHQVVNLEEKIQQVYDFYRKSQILPPNHLPEEEVISSPSKQNLSKSLTTKCNFILKPLRNKQKRNSYCYEKKIRQFNPSIKQKNADADQIDVANQMIENCKRDTYAFSNTIKKFKAIIHEASIDFLQKQEVPATSFNKSGGLSTFFSNQNRESITKTYSQQKQQSLSYRIMEKPQLYDLNPNDIYTVLKKSNQIINATRVQKDIQANQQLNSSTTTSFNVICRKSGQKPNKYDKNFKKYFKNSIMKKHISKIQVQTDKEVTISK